jgi:hypothetical protein
VMAAVNIKNIPTGPGDDIKIDATWAKGDTKNVISTSGASPSFAMFGSSSRPGAYQSIAVGYTSDGVFVPGGAIDLTYGATGIRTGHPACSAATRPFGTMANQPSSRYCTKR